MITSPGARTNGSGEPTTTQELDPWPHLLAPRLMTPPVRWGWQAAVAPAPAPVAAPPDLVGSRPAWTEPPRPDTSALRSARSKAVSKLVRRVAFAVVVGVSFTAYQVTIEQSVDQQGTEARQVYGAVVLVVGALLAISIVRAMMAIGTASQNITRFEQPYLTYRAAEHARYQHAVRSWEQARQSYATQVAHAAQAAAAYANGPQWYPVAPAAAPTRVDVLGGDPRRNGWASLLATMGTSVLGGRRRVTVLDYTGFDVGGGLARLAVAAGIGTRRAAVGAGSGPDLLGALDRAGLAESLAWTVTSSEREADRREERAFLVDILRRVAGSVDAPLTFPRLAAGVDVLRQGAGDDRLTADEIGRLVQAHLGDVDRGEWTSRRLRLLANQLMMLAEASPASSSPAPLWVSEPVSIVTTEGGRGDRKELVDRLVTRLAQRAIDQGDLDGVVVLAGADRLGADTLETLSDQARQRGVQLVLMIDQPQGDLERIAGTGGAVCLMKMYNHRDANVAAEFVGRGHRFVLNQVTHQVGKTFSDTGGDSFAANTGGSASHKQSGTGGRGKRNELSDSRGHTWTGTRGWSSADNLGTSTSSSRVYEFVVEPQQILGMPETAFILVDSTGPGRRVVLADANPGICLLDRVAAVPAG